MNIVIIGTGNTASVLGRKLRRAGHKIVQLFGRSEEAASLLAGELEAESIQSVHAVNGEAGLYLLAVSDHAVPEVAAQLPLTEGIVVHTAGSVSLQVLRRFAHSGVFYPLQSLKKTSQHVPEVPLLLDASDEPTLQKLRELADSISGNVVTAGDEERQKLHLAAVFCNNFSNHLFALAEHYCRQEHLQFNLLLPLLQETVARLEEMPAKAAQTGPAIRFDEPTLQKHLVLLDPHPQLQSVYRLLTQSIQQLDLQENP